jgi:release factor glutamine methyltransferase
MEFTTDPLWNIKQRLYAAGPPRQTTIRIMGHDFFANPGVFSPADFRSTAIFTEGLDYPVGGSFWEVGCGTGVTAVVAALEGCKRVLASDISSDAVKNARQNVSMYFLSSVVQVRCGDLFDVLLPGEKFDTIYWNSNFVHVPEDYVFDEEIHHAFADPGYKAHNRFFKEAALHLESNGKILLGFSSQGDRDALDALLSSYNYSSRTVSSRTATGPDPHRFDIVELTPL